jgi:hypothetical protein
MLFRPTRKPVPEYLEPQFRTELAQLLSRYPAPIPNWRRALCFAEAKHIILYPHLHTKSRMRRLICAKGAHRCHRSQRQNGHEAGDAGRAMIALNQRTRKRVKELEENYGPEWRYAQTLSEY